MSDIILNYCIFLICLMYVNISMFIFMHAFLCLEYEIVPLNSEKIYMYIFLSFATVPGFLYNHTCLVYKLETEAQAGEILCDRFLLPFHRFAKRLLQKQ